MHQFLFRYTIGCWNTIVNIVMWYGITHRPIYHIIKSIEIPKTMYVVQCLGLELAGDARNDNVSP